MASIPRRKVAGQSSLLEKSGKRRTIECNTEHRALTLRQLKPSRARKGRPPHQHRAAPPMAQPDGGRWRNATRPPSYHSPKLSISSQTGRKSGFHSRQDQQRSDETDEWPPDDPHRRRVVLPYAPEAKGIRMFSGADAKAHEHWSIQWVMQPPQSPYLEKKQFACFRLAEFQAGFAGEGSNGRGDGRQDYIIGGSVTTPTRTIGNAINMR